MVLLLSSLLFVLTAALGMTVGLRFWIRPKAAVDRLMQTSAPESRTAANLFIETLRRLLDAAGRRMGSREKDRERVIQQLAGAGFRKSGAVNLYNGSRMVASVVLCVAAAGGLSGTSHR